MGGKFNFKHFIDPLGVTVGKGQTGGVLGILDPLNVTGAATKQKATDTSATAPAVAPPITAANAEVMQAQQDLIQREMLKKSIKKTVLAGDTGGYKPQQPAGLGGKGI